MNDRPLLAETVLIDGEPKAIKIGEYQYQIMQKYAYESAKSWNDFMIDALYKTYKKLGISHVLLICEEDFERYLKETLPDWIKKERDKAHE
jgi:uncharacterized protein (DUF1778 family)